MPSALEHSYPHIAAELARIWRQADVDSYLQQLIVEERLDREGFPWGVIEELMFLSDLRWTINHGAKVLQVAPRVDDYGFASSDNAQTWVLMSAA